MKYFMKAFDSVPHDLLLLKLKTLGIVGKNLNWFKSYLTERTQKVVIKEQISEPIVVDSGVPQGGVLSGLLFALYINDVTKCFRSCQVSLYADDAKIYYGIDDQSSITQVQADLDRFYQWCETWRIKLNISKCFYLHHGRKAKELNLEYKFNNVPLKRESEAKDLGVIVSDDLKWHRQTTHASNKAKAQIHVIRRTFKSRNPKFLSNMYKLKVRPHMEYCCEVWNPHHRGDIIKLEKTQDMMTRLLNFGRVMTPAERNEYMKLPTHEERRTRGDLIKTYTYIEDPTMFTVDTTETRLRNGRHIEMKHSRIDAKKYSLSRRTTQVWNKLPKNVVKAENTKDFKRKLDKHMGWP